jgi:hypothetical protein
MQPENELPANQNRNPRLKTNWLITGWVGFVFCGYMLAILSERGERILIAVRSFLQDG